MCLKKIMCYYISTITSNSKTCLQFQKTFEKFEKDRRKTCQKFKIWPTSGVQSCPEEFESPSRPEMGKHQYENEGSYRKQNYNRKLNLKKNVSQVNCVICLLCFTEHDDRSGSRPPSIRGGGGGGRPSINRVWRKGDGKTGPNQVSNTVSSSKVSLFHNVKCFRVARQNGAAM